jgi:gamma-glutamylcyclotransferase (GGCT)/AIG2-like uncharacterized protein YtfP
MASVGGHQRLDLSKSLTFVGPCQINGRLVDLGSYPGLIVGDGIVEAELYEVTDDAVFRRLDPFEGYDPRYLRTSLYVRRRVRLVNPRLDAWAFFYNQDVEGKPIIETGSWKRPRTRGMAPRRTLD